MRSKQEIAAEIEAVKLLKPVGPHARSTQKKLELVLEELTYGVDDSAEEWNELRDTDQDLVNTTRLWKEGDSDDRPSQGWGPLVTI